MASPHHNHPRGKHSSQSFLYIYYETHYPSNHFPDQAIPHQSTTTLSIKFSTASVPCSPFRQQEFIVFVVYITCALLWNWWPIKHITAPPTKNWESKLSLKIAESGIQTVLQNFPPWYLHFIVSCIGFQLTLTTITTTVLLLLLPHELLNISL